MIIQRLAIVGIKGLRVQIVQLGRIGRVDHDELHAVHGRAAIHGRRLHAEAEEHPV